MSPLEAHLAESVETPERNPLPGSIGEESGWLEFGELKCHSGKFLIIDPAFAPEKENGAVVECSPGEYKLFGKVLDYSGDKRVSRLRLICPSVTADLSSDPKPIAEVWADVACIGVCDAESFLAAWNSNPEQAEDDQQEYIENSGPAGVFIVAGRADAPLKYVSSGFGDGTFPVFELTDGSKRVGFEVEFIARDEPYPFGRAEQRPSPEAASTPNPAPEAMLKALAQFERTGNKEADKERLRQLLNEAMAPVAQGLRDVSNQLHADIISARRNAPPMQLKLQPTEGVKLSEGERRRLDELVAAGFSVISSFTTALPNTHFSYAIFGSDGIIADVSFSPEKIRMSLFVDFPDESSVAVRDFATHPGITQPEWLRQIDMPGATVPEMLTALRNAGISEARRCSAVEIPPMIERGFARLQAWRAERGGWTADEIRKQAGGDIDPDELLMRRHNIADVWLFNWLRIQQNLSFRPGDELESLVIVHDEIPPDLLQCHWVWSTNDFEARGKRFKEGTSRDSFAAINTERGFPLKLVARKTTGFPADFYLKA